MEVKKYKIEIFTLRDSFSCEHETDNPKEILSGIYSGLTEGVIQIVTANSNTETEEIVVIPREKIEYVKITPLRIAGERSEINEFV